MSTLFSIFIKTIDNQIKEFKVNTTTTIDELKTQIEQQLSHPKAKQRIIFSGKVLKDSETIHFHSISEGMTVHLIILENIRQEDHLESLNSDLQNSTSNSRRRTIGHINNSTSPFQSRVVQNIFRTLNHSTNNRRLHRQKMVQQRNFGFLVNEKESCEIIRQNLITLKQLNSSKIGQDWNYEVNFENNASSNHNKLSKNNQKTITEKSSVDLNRNQIDKITKQLSVKTSAKGAHFGSTLQTNGPFEQQNNCQISSDFMENKMINDKKGLDLTKTPEKHKRPSNKDEYFPSKQKSEFEINEQKNNKKLESDNSLSNSKKNNGKNDLSESESSPQKIEAMLDLSKKNHNKKNRPFLHETAISPFNFCRRVLEIGQWIDVKDNVFNWLEGEVIAINENQVLIHYNGFSKKWDTWMPMNSPHILPFRTNTVQSHKSMYLSPVPRTKLDGDLNGQSLPNADAEELFKQVLDQIDAITEQLDALLELIDQTKSIDEKVDLIKIRDVDQFVKGQEENLNKMNDNLSLKIRVTDFVLDKKKEETISMKSLRFQSNEVRLGKEGRQKREMSPNSMKSQFSNEHNFLIDDEIEELIEEESSFQTHYIQKIMQQEQVRKRIVEQQMRAHQLAPILDRLGRAMIDLSPHLAILGSAYIVSSAHNHEYPMMSTATLDGGSILSNTIAGIYDRFNNLQNSGVFAGSSKATSNVYGDLANRRNRRSIANNNQFGENKFISDRFLNFQIPVMLNPGELYAIENSESPFQNDGFVDLNIRVNVRPKSKKMKAFGIQTDLTEEEKEIQFDKKKMGN